MKADIYLRQLEILEMKIEHKRREAEKISSLITSAATSSQISDSKVQTSFDVHRWEGTAVDMLEVGEDISKDMKAYIHKRQEIAAQIYALEDPKHIKVLSGKYLYYKTLAEIAGDEGYSYVYVRKIITKALIAFEDKYLTGNKKGTKVYKSIQHYTM